MIKLIRNYFSKGELLLWSASSLLVIISFLLFDRKNYLILSASLIGVTYLILNSKGNPSGQVLVIVFSLMYGVISYNFSYFGEMITYLGMTTPMAVLALISWLKNPNPLMQSESPPLIVSAIEVYSAEQSPPQCTGNF